MSHATPVRPEPAPPTGPTPTGPWAAPAEPARKGSLLRAEVLRFRTRRLVVGLLLAALVGFLAIGAFAFTQFAQPSAADLAAAEANIAVFMAESEEFRQECLAEELPDGVTPEDYCGTEATAADYPVESFLDKAPFDLGTDFSGGALETGFAIAALAFVVGATFVGAEWSQRSMVALLFWQPRRGLVLSRKLFVATVAGALLGAVFQVLWLGFAVLLGALRGSSETPDGFTMDVLVQDARLVLLAALTGLLGAALANLLRGTGAVLGVAFVYFALVETALGAFRQEWREWLLSTGALALGQLQGTTVFVYEEQLQPDGSVFYDSREIVVSGLQGGLVLAVATAVVVVLGSVLFLRRDLQ